MTSPPPQNPWAPGPGAPGPGQPGFGPPPQGQPYGAPQGQQQPWYPPPEPPKQGRGLKWALVAVTLIAAIAIAVAATMYFTRGDSGSNSSSATPTTSGIASANDKGPVTVITEDPSCASWIPVLNGLATAEGNGWDKRDASVPSSAWTPEQRTQYDVVGRAMRSAAEQTVPLAKLTTHRVMRELYEQFIAYSRAYADRVSTYTASDDHLAGVSNGISSAIGSICDAITFQSAQHYGPMVAPAEAPSPVAPVGDFANPRQFLASRNSICEDWESAARQFDADTDDWSRVSADIPANEWNAEQKSLYDSVAPVISKDADTLERLGRRSGNPILHDFSLIAAQYYRAFVRAAPAYTPADNYLYKVGTYTAGAVRAGCQMVGG